MPTTSITSLSNHELLAETARLVAAERHTTAQLIALLAEVDRRELYLAEGYASLFTYCTQALHLSEHAAYDRIRAARLSRQCPVVLERLTDGAVTLSTVGLLAPHITGNNCERLLEAARHQSKRDVERLVATLAPKPDVSASGRRLPAPRPTAPVAAASLFGSGDSLAPSPSELADGASPLPAEPSPAPMIGAARAPIGFIAQRSPRAIIAPLAPERYLIKITVGRETHDRLRRAQDLLRHAIPSGDPAAIVDRALTLLVEQLERAKHAATRRPRATATAAPNTRRIPANVRRLVWARDGGRCAFVGTHGRCAETAWLEFHHVVPYAAGGMTSVDNLSLRCRSHNAHEAAEYFGPARPGASSIGRAPRPAP